MILTTPFVSTMGYRFNHHPALQVLNGLSTIAAPFCALCAQARTDSDAPVVQVIAVVVVS